MAKKMALGYHAVAVVLLLALVLWYALPLIQTESIGYDGAYNAQVAKHYARTGVYATTYPEELRFYKAITTGHTVLLPVAWLYQLLGVSYVSTAAVPLVFSCLYLLAAYALFYALTRGSWCTPFAVCLFALLPTYWRNVLTPVGENAALCLLFCALLSMVCAERAPSSGGWRWALAGGLLAVAFITKTIVLLYVGIFLVLMALECAIFQTIPWKSLLRMLLGFAVGFLVFDLFRLVQWQWSLRQWIRSWLYILGNTVRLGGHEGGLFQGVQLSAVWEKLSAISQMSITPHPILFICQLLLPVGWYLARLLAVLRKKRDLLQSLDNRLDKVMVFSGIAGEAFLIYVILFGSADLVLIRRLFIHLAMLQVFTGYALCRAAQLAWAAYQGRAGRGGLAAWALRAGLLAGCGAFLVGTSALRLGAVMQDRIQGAGTISETRVLNEELIAAVEALPADATIVTQGWWQAPEIALFADRAFIPWAPGMQADDHTYFLMADEVEAPADWTGDPDDLLGWLGSIADYETVVHLESESAPSPHTYSLFQIRAFSI